jgi:hypothetical protein
VTGMGAQAWVVVMVVVVSNNRVCGVISMADCTRRCAVLTLTLTQKQEAVYDLRSSWRTMRTAAQLRLGHC